MSDFKFIGIVKQKHMTTVEFFSDTDFGGKYPIRHKIVHFAPT